jgi:hypothetical protein
MSKSGTDRAKLALLADALIEDLMATPDADIIAEVGQADIDRARAMIVEVKRNQSRQLLTEARRQLDTWRAAQLHSKPALDRKATRDRFENFRSADPAFNQKMTMAARNGTEPTDSDKEGLIEDWADLQRLDEQDEPE